jgi:hypothetical protein
MRRNMMSGSLLLAFLLAIFFTVAPAKPAPQAKPKATKAGATMTYGNSDSITEEEMKIYDYFLASDQLEGRNLPSRGYDTAALYVASHLAEWHLKPGGSTTGTNGPLQPYFMPIELVSKQVNPEDSKASITAPGGGGRGGRGGGGGGGRGAAAGAAQPVTTNFEFGKDWTVAAGGRGAPPLESLEATGNLVFVGNGYVITKSNSNPYAGLDVKGKIVVVAGLPPEIAALQAALAGRGGRGGAAAGPNPLGVNCTDFWTPEQAAAKNGAVAVVRIADFQQISAMSNTGGARGGTFATPGGVVQFGGRGAALNGPPYQVVKFQTAAACPSVPAVTAGLEMTNAIFQGERIGAAQVFYAAGSNAKLDSFALNAEKKINLHVAVNTLQNHGENVVGILEGSDPVLKNEYVIISAHLDHIGLSQPMADGHNVNNGADDDGSGSTGLLAIARAYAEGAAKGIRPKRSVVFLWNAGEEKGLWGSQYFNMFPPIDLTKVVADLNIDMIGRSKNPNSVDPDPSHYLVDHGNVLVVGPNISSDDLEKTLETVNNNYQKLGIDHFYDATAPDKDHDNKGPGITADQPFGRGQGIFYRSDHYNFAKMGIPIAFFTIGLHVDYHQPTDTPEKIDYKEIQIVSKTVSAVGWVLANQPNKPQLKADLPQRLKTDMEDAKKNGWGKITPVMPPLPGEPF